MNNQKSKLDFLSPDIMKACDVAPLGDGYHVTAGRKFFGMNGSYPHADGGKVDAPTFQQRLSGKRFCNTR